MKILPEMYLWTRKSAVNFGNHLDPDENLESVEIFYPWLEGKFIFR